MSKKPFAHLHFHTQYSLLDGACKVNASMKRARDLGMDSLAITDHGVLYGIIDFYKSAQKAGIKPLLGCEVYTTPPGIAMSERKTGVDGSQSQHLVLLAENRVGYQNLMRLVSKGHLDGFYYKPRIDKALLREYSEGIIGLSACLKGEIPEYIVKGNMNAAMETTEEYIDILGKENFYLELQDHGIAEQRIANEGILEIAKKTGLKTVVTNDVHYVDAGHAPAHDCMICLQGQTVMSDPNRMRYGSDQFYMKSPDEMWAAWGDHADALMNTVEIAERCNVDLNLGKEFHFPTYDVPEGFTQKNYLIHVAKRGLARLYDGVDIDNPKNPDEKKIAERFYYELGIIERTKFINYFLVVWDFIQYAHDHKIPVGPGRGSGAGSILAYALGITGIDPLRYNLIFERFLNPERVSPPDFDIDFCQARRGEVIEYVKNKYGRENVAQIITFGTLGAKTVIRDVGRVLEIPFAECDRLAKLIPEEPGMTLDKALAQSPDFKKATETDDHLRRIMQYATVLEGMSRQPGTHAAGVVIGEKPLIEILPLARDKDKEVVTQFEMKPMEETGLLKMDFLGLKTLTVIREALNNIEKIHGQEIDISAISMKDKKTFELLNRGDTIGVFQVESQGMRELLRRIGIDRFEDLIAMIALYRPGPMNMLDDFVARKHGKVKLTYDHPLLEAVLQETYGIMLYQEQVQQAARDLAGFSLGEGDMLRRAMGKKDPDIMKKYREKFVKGCKETNRIEKPLATKIFDNIERFAGYGFNKSHSAAYAIISWQTAYLKAHHPAEFMAGLLSSEMGNTDKLPVFIAECKAMGMDVLPPSVNESDTRFTPVGNTIRFGLAGVKNVGAGAVEVLVNERNKNGPFKGLLDFCMRLGGGLVNRKMLESLVQCGAFDFTGYPRGRLFPGIEFALNRATEEQRDKASGQTSLFDLMAHDDGPQSNTDEELPEGDSWPLAQMLAAEKELLGFYISGHPLSEYEWALNHFATHTLSDCSDLPGGTHVRVGGLVTGYVKRFTKKTQEPMGSFQLEGLSDTISAVAFPETFRNYGVYLFEDAAVMVGAEIRAGEQNELTVNEIYPLDQVHKPFAQRISVHLPTAHTDENTLHKVVEIVKKHPGETPLILCLIFPGDQKIFINAASKLYAAATHELAEELEKFLGEDSVYVAANRKSIYKKYDPTARRSAWSKRASVPA